MARSVILSASNQSVSQSVKQTTDITTTLLLLLPFYSCLDFVRDYPGELVPER